MAKRRSRKGSKKSRKGSKKSRKSRKGSKKSRVNKAGMAIDCKSSKKNSCAYNPNCQWRKKVGCVRRRSVLKGRGVRYAGPSGPSGPSFKKTRKARKSKNTFLAIEDI